MCYETLVKVQGFYRMHHLGRLGLGVRHHGLRLVWRLCLLASWSAHEAAAEQIEVCAAMNP